MKGVVLVLLLVLGCLRWSDAASPKALENFGLGHRMTSVYNFEDGSGFMADLELIQRTEVYGPDISPLRMVVRYANFDYSVILSAARVVVSLMRGVDCESYVFFE